MSNDSQKSRDALRLLPPFCERGRLNCVAFEQNLTAITGEVFYSSLFLMASSREADDPGEFEDIPCDFEAKASNTKRMVASMQRRDRKSARKALAKAWGTLRSASNVGERCPSVSRIDVDLPHYRESKGRVKINCRSAVNALAKKNGCRRLCCRAAVPLKRSAKAGNCSTSIKQFQRIHCTCATVAAAVLHYSGF